jgi:hypothetical protein
MGPKALGGHPWAWRTRRDQLGRAVRPDQPDLIPLQPQKFDVAYCARL